jgi:hypothetical protein
VVIKKNSIPPKRLKICAIQACKGGRPSLNTRTNNNKTGKQEIESSPTSIKKGWTIKYFKESSLIIQTNTQEVNSR